MVRFPRFLHRLPVRRLPEWCWMPSRRFPPSDRRYRRQPCCPNQSFPDRNWSENRNWQTPRSWEPRQNRFPPAASRATRRRLRKSLRSARPPTIIKQQNDFSYCSPMYTRFDIYHRIACFNVKNKLKSMTILEIIRQNRNK